MNLVSTIMQLLAPAIINKIAASLGVNQGIVGKIVAAAIPTILAGLAGSSSKSGGASILSDLLGKQDPGLLGNFANMLGGNKQQGLIDGGTSALSSLLGGSSTNALAGALGKFSGATDSQSKSLLGMLAPVVLGQLASTQKSSGLDAAGLASLLSGQKSNIAAAMPDGFAKLVQGTGLLDSVRNELSSEGVHIPRTGPRTTPVVEGSSLWKIFVPVALAALAMYWYGNRNKAPITLPDPVTSAGQVIPAALGTEVTSVLDGLKSTLGGITDEATAKTAAPKLQDYLAQIEKAKGTASALAPDARKPLAGMIAAALPGLAGTIEKLLGIPGVSAVLKPVLDKLLGNLNDMSKA